MPKPSDFETWMRFTVPWQLCLSRSKQVAMQHKFSHFGALARALQMKAPQEYQRFFDALQATMDEVLRGAVIQGREYRLLQDQHV